MPDKSHHKITSHTKRMLALCIDIAALILAFYLASLITAKTFNVQHLIIAIALGILCLTLSGAYRAIVSQIGKNTITKIIMALSITAITLYALTQNVFFSLFFFFTSTITILGWRYLRVILCNIRAPQRSPRIRIAIYGAGEAGTQAAASFKHDQDYHPICFFDDNKDLQGRISLDLPIYAPDKINKVITKHQIDRIILAIPSSTRKTRNLILKRLENCNVPIQTLPGMRDILSGKANIDDVRNIDPLDLLGRDSVPPNNTLLSKCITGKTVMVTGAGGSIGTEICRQVAELKPKQLVLFDVSEYALYNIALELEKYSDYCPTVSILGSVQDKSHIKQVIKHHNVQTIYHAAAYKHVPIVENNIAEAFKNNTLGTLYTAQAAMAENVDHFVLISTDKAVRPSSAMGVTKRLAEQTLLALSLHKKHKTKFCFVRFGNVLGSSGSVIPLFIKQIAKGGPITITDPEMIRYFMSIPEAAQLVIQAGAMAENGDAFTLDMGEPVKILDMAKRLIRLSGLKPKIENEEGDIKIEYTGLRPGEKLYEELHIDKNAVHPTTHSRIFKEKNTIANDRKILEQIQSLTTNKENSELRNDLFALTESET